MSISIPIQNFPKKDSISSGCIHKNGGKCELLKGSENNACNQKNHLDVIDGVQAQIDLCDALILSYGRTGDVSGANETEEKLSMWQGLKDGVLDGGTSENLKNE